MIPNFYEDLLSSRQSMYESENYAILNLNICSYLGELIIAFAEWYNFLIFNERIKIVRSDSFHSTFMKISICFNRPDMQINLIYLTVKQLLMIKYIWTTTLCATNHWKIASARLFSFSSIKCCFNLLIKINENLKKQLLEFQENVEHRFKKWLGHLDLFKRYEVF